MRLPVVDQEVLAAMPPGVRIPPRTETSARGSAHRAGDVGLIENHAFFGHAVMVRGPDAGIPAPPV